MFISFVISVPMENKKELQFWTQLFGAGNANSKRLGGPKLIFFGAAPLNPLGRQRWGCVCVCVCGGVQRPHTSQLIN